MDDIIIIKTSERPVVVVCDLGVFEWLELPDGIVLVDYRYLMELQKKHGG